MKDVKVTKEFIRLLKIEVKNKTLETILKYKNKDYYEINKKDKGFIGNFIQKMIFDIDRNTSRLPDFIDENIELKVTPMKQKDDGTFTSKERLVCNMINYNEIISENSFFDSSFFKKNSKLLIFFYLHVQDYLKEDRWKNIKILELDLFNLLDFDEIEQIEKDYFYIKEKVKNGKAHEISGSDTEILEACTKGSSLNNTTSQPFSNVNAKKRAFAFKSKFVTKLFFKALNSDNYFNLNLDTPQKISNLVMKHKGESISDLLERYHFNTNSKSFRIYLILNILNVKNINEISAIYNYDLSIKTVVLESNGNLVESIPLLKINPFDLENDFENSDFYYAITKPYLFVIFEKENDNKLNDKIKDCFLLDLSKTKEIISKAKIVYDHTRNLFLNGGILEKTNTTDKYNFIKLKDNLDFHIRPKAKDKNDRYLTPYGEKITKQAFWLNNKTFVHLYNEFKKNKMK